MEVKTMIVMNNVFFSGLNYKSIEEAKDGLANVYKSITGNDLKQQIKTYQKILNNSESITNIFMRMYPEFLNIIGYKKRIQVHIGQQQKIGAWESSRPFSYYKLRNRNPEIKKEEVRREDITKEKIKNTIIIVYVVIYIEMMLLYFFKANIGNDFLDLIIENYLNPIIQNVIFDYLKQIAGISSEKNVTLKLINIENINIGCAIYNIEEKDKK